jgi:hypothetical protein
MTSTKRRGGHKTRLTKLINTSYDDISSEDPHCATLELNLQEILRQKDIITNYDNIILDELEDESLIVTEIDTASDYMITVEAAVKLIRKTLDNLLPSTPRHGTAKSVQLPQIQLIKFSGDSLQWPKFWDLYRSSIHNRTDLSGATKFHYLVTQLTGEAEQLMAGFDHTDGEYSEAVKLLTETYGKPQRIIQARLHALFDLTKPNSNSKDLSRFRSLYEGHLRGLKSLGADVNAAGYVFCELLIRKLPNKIRDNLNRANKSDFWNLDDLRREIDIEIGHLQSLEPETLSHDSQNNTPMPTAVFNTSTYSSANSNTINSNTNSNSNANSNYSYARKCNFCYSAHASVQCTKYVSVNSRRARVNELKLCFNCLKGNHMSNNCNNDGRCRKCKSKHHTAICTKTIDASINQKVHANVNTNSNSGTNVQSNSINVRSTVPNTLNAMTTLSVNNSSVNSCTNILPTACLAVVHNYSNSTSNVKAILDSGSQRTFILRTVCNNLHLPVVGRVNLSIDGFNSIGNNKTYDITEFHVTTSDGLIKMSAVIIDSLPSRIDMTGRSEVVNKLKSKGILLADPTVDSDTVNDIGMLVGVDYFFSLLGASPSENGLYTMPSRIGTIIGGPLINNSNTSCNHVTFCELIPILTIL